MNFQIDKKIFNRFPEMESERLLFREILLRDSRDIFLLRSNGKVMKFMDSPKMESLKDSEKFIKNIKESFKNKNGISWAIIEKYSGMLTGYFGFWRIVPEHCRAEIGFALDPEYWGKGFMTETLSAMIKFGFGKLKLHSIEANVNPGNISCIKVLEKMGFCKEAYFKENILSEGKYADSIIYSLLESNGK